MQQLQRSALGGLLRRREQWTLSARGWLLILALLVAFGIALRFGLYPFLAITNRVPADLLVVEGWIPPNTMPEAAVEFSKGGYQRIVLIHAILDKGDQARTGHFLGDYLSRLLLADGVPREKLWTLFPDVTRTDRTYHSALVVKQWAADEGFNVESLDVATVGPHSRRSRLLFQKAFGDGVKVGIVAMDDHEYDPKHWWRTSEGVREVIGESIAYVYARFLFRAPSSD